MMNHSCFVEKDLMVSASTEDLLELVEHIERGDWSNKWSDLAYIIRLNLDPDFAKQVEEG